MEQNVPEYVKRSVPVPQTARVPWYKSTFPSHFGIFLFVGYYLKLAGLDDRVRQPNRCSVGAGGRRAALLRALLLRAGNAWHADRTQSLRSGHLDVRNHGRISHSRNSDGTVAGGLGGGGRRPRRRASS